MGIDYVQWKFPLDTVGFRHMSKSEHVSAIQCVQWKLSLDTSRTRNTYGYENVIETGKFLITTQMQNHFKIFTSLMCKSHTRKLTKLDGETNIACF